MKWLLVFLVVVQAACSKGSDNPGMPQISNCVDDSQRCCPGCNPDLSMGALKAAAAGASMSFQTADAALKNVEAFKGKQASGISQLASAATAKDIPGVSTPNNGSPPSLGDGSGSGRNGSRAGGSAGSVGMGGSLGFELGVKKTGPSEFAAKSAAAGALQDGGGYTSGGGGGAKNSGWSSGGELSISGASATHGEFGSGSGVSPMGSDDPMDYFARLSLDDSLFKIVERRYQAKHVSWKQGDESTAIARSRRP